MKRVMFAFLFFAVNIKSTSCSFPLTTGAMVLPASVRLPPVPQASSGLGSA